MRIQLLQLAFVLFVTALLSSGGYFLWTNGRYAKRQTRIATPRSRHHARGRSHYSPNL